jgi:hypothetical protein
LPHRTQRSAQPCRLLFPILLLAWGGAAQATDSYNGSELTIPALAIGAGTYSDVVVTPGSILSVAGGPPNGSVDSYDPATNRLTIPSVTYQGTTYTNVTITVGALVSIGSVTGVDTVSGADLLIPSVQLLGGGVYQNVVITWGAIDSGGGGMPTGIRDTYDPATHRLTIAAIEVGGKVYTNGVVTLASLVSYGGPPQPTDVVTYKYDVLRSGANLTETILTPANVNATTFGLLRTLSVDSTVDAQPLYLSQLGVAGASHDVVFVATEHDSVYAFDADTGATLWHVSLIPSGETSSDTRSCDQVTPEIGITSTPVIDPGAGAHGVMFVVAMTRDASSRYHQRLHALDVTTGAEIAGSPTEITATYGATTFAPGNYKERAALLLTHGTIYTSWASHCDNGDYGGWIIGINESTLAISTSLNVAQGASGSGYANEGPAIWMSGGGPAADAAGNVYLLTANGKFDTTLDATGFPSGGDYGNSFLKLTNAAGTLVVSDYFAMYNEVSESTGDGDLGSGGILLLPDQTDAGGTVRQLAVGAGKDAEIYVVDRNHLGGFNAVGNDNWQQVSGSLGGSVYSTPAWFNGTLFYGPASGTLKAYRLSQALVPSTPTSQTAISYPNPGTFPVVSANGTTNAIVWAYQNSSPAVLHAYSAASLGTELYNSNQAANNRDQFGSGNKLVTPVVADGKVFVPTPHSVAVFGLLP